VNLRADERGMLLQRYLTEQASPSAPRAGLGEHCRGLACVARGKRSKARFGHRATC